MCVLPHKSLQHLSLHCALGMHSHHLPILVLHSGARLQQSQLPAGRRLHEEKGKDCARVQSQTHNAGLKDRLSLKCQTKNDASWISFLALSVRATP